MKKTVLFLLLLAAAVSVQAQTTFKDAVEYNDYIVVKQQRIGALLNEYISMAADSAPTLPKLEAKRISAVDEVKKLTSDLKKMPAWKGNIAFRDASVTLFVFYQSTLDNEFKEIGEILLKTEITEADYKRIEELQKSISTREGPLDDVFLDAQKKFAAANNFTITPDGN